MNHQSNITAWLQTSQHRMHSASQCPEYATRGDIGCIASSRYGTVPSICQLATPLVQQLYDHMRHGMVCSYDMKLACMV